MAVDLDMDRPRAGHETRPLRRPQTSRVSVLANVVVVLKTKQNKIALFTVPFNYNFATCSEVVGGRASANVATG